jgi:hypothetical protein
MSPWLSNTTPEPRPAVVWMSTTRGSTVAAMRTKAACKLSAVPGAAGAVLVVPVATGAAAGFSAELHAVSPGHRKAATTAMDVERCIAPTVAVGARLPHPVAA